MCSSAKCMWFNVDMGDGVLCSSCNTCKALIAELKSNPSQLSSGATNALAEL